VHHAMILSPLVVVGSMLPLCCCWHDGLCVQVKNGNRKDCEGNPILFLQM